MKKKDEKRMMEEDDDDDNYDYEWVIKKKVAKKWLQAMIKPCFVLSKRHIIWW
jgi:hypothetical protein